MANLIGQSIGKYHILEELGEGGMAVVYKAYDRRLEREVAIKVILPSKQNSQKFIKRFEREARLLARLSHPNIVKILDYGTFDGIPYLVMEYVRGQTLKSRLPGNFSWREAFKIVSPIARALEVVHRQKIVHRDIKPSNILMDEDGRVLVSDFGVAKFYEDEETSELTGTGVGIGTPEYMSPEQVMGHNVDLRSDIYSLGILLYQVITQRTPYRADTPMAVGFKQVSEPLPRPQPPSGKLPDAVEYVLIKALAKRPEDRYQSMAEFANAMDKLLNNGTSKDEKRVSSERKLFRKNALSMPYARVGAILGASIMIFGFGWLLTQSQQRASSTEGAVIPEATLTLPAAFLPTTIRTMTPTISETPGYTETSMGMLQGLQWTLTDAQDVDIEKLADLIEGSASLNGNTLDVYLRVADIPEQITVARASVPNDGMEYAWQVNIDVDNNGVDDYQFGIFLFRFSGSQERNVSPADVNDWGQITFFQADGNSWNRGDGKVVAEMDPDTDFIHITATSDALTPGMTLTAQAYVEGSGDDFASFLGSSSSSPLNQSATLTPAEANSQFDKSDIWNVEIQQFSSSEIMVTFEYQIQSSIDLDDVLIGASPEGCYENIAFIPVEPATYSGKYIGNQGVEVWLDKPGICKLDKLSVAIFSEKNNGHDYYREEFTVPISMEKSD